MVGLRYFELFSVHRVLRFEMNFGCGGATSNALMSNDFLSNAAYVAMQHLEHLTSIDSNVAIYSNSFINDVYVAIYENVALL